MTTSRPPTWTFPTRSSPGRVRSWRRCPPRNAVALRRGWFLCGRDGQRFGDTVPEEGPTMGIVVMIIVGLIAGFVARALVPGRDPMGVVGTIVLGIVGS